MRKAALVTALLGLSLSGCTYTYPVAHPLTDTVDQVNRLALDRSGRIELRSGLSFPFTQLQVNADSASWADLEAGERRAVTTLDIDRIVVQRRERGARQGSGLGFLLGTAGAWVFFYTTSTDPCSGCNPLMAAGFAGGLPGVLIGLIAGSIRGSKDIFLMPPPR